MSHKIMAIDLKNVRQQARFQSNLLFYSKKLPAKIGIT